MKINIEYSVRPFDPSWSLEEWTVFRYHGMPSRREVFIAGVFLIILMHLLIVLIPIFRAGCLNVFMTPSPGTCPRDSDKGITTDVMRTTMAATGDRNQRRIANLKTVNIDVIESDQNESDSDDDVVVCSLNGQKTIFCHFGWSNEKDRLESQSIYLTVWL